MPHLPKHEGCRVRPSEGLFTVVAGWEAVEDNEGCSVSPDMLPVVIYVKAALGEAALEVASDKLQEHFGPKVAELFSSDIARDHWFGLDGDDAYLRLSAVFIGHPDMLHDDAMYTVLR